MAASNNGVPGNGCTETFTMFAPLQGFLWTGDDFEFAPGVRIRRLGTALHENGLEQLLAEDLVKDMLSEEERRRALSARHCLGYDCEAEVVPSAGELVNLLLLSLWLVRPTQSRVSVRWRSFRDGRRNVTRLLDRFSWIDNAVHSGFDDDDLRAASQLYGSLAKRCRARGRLNDALQLTLAGCWALRWQVALICHASAAETILTYSRDRGLTERLATSYACLTAAQTQQRDIAFAQFKQLYSLRSDVVHGRMHTVPDWHSTLVQFQEVLRRLWRAVCRSDELVKSLEGQDDERRACLTKLAEGYRPPRNQPFKPT